MIRETHIRAGVLLLALILAAGTASAIYPDRDGVVLDMRFSNDSSVGEAYSNPSHNETVYDYSDAQNNGTTKNNITYDGTGGVWDGAFEFDGVDDYVIVSDDNTLDTGATFTVSFWANPTEDTQPGGIVAKKGNSANQWAIWKSSTDLYYETAYTGSWSSIPSFETGDNYYVIVPDGTAVRFYKNGQNVYNGTLAVETGNNSESLYIGVKYNSGGADWRYFNGTIDEVRIYNRSLTADEIYEDYITSNKSNGICYCTGCDDCEAKLSDAGCTDVRLTQDITNYAGTCINDPAGFTSKTFDCQGNTIDGTGVTDDHGMIYTTNNNNYIKNCTLQEATTGLQIAGNNNTIVDITAKSNRGSSAGYLYARGLFVPGSDNTFTNINASDNVGMTTYGPPPGVAHHSYGIHVSGSNNTFTNVIASNNEGGYNAGGDPATDGYGIYVSGSNNTFTDITASYNEGGNSTGTDGDGFGMYLVASGSYNLLGDLTTCFNRNYDIYNLNLTNTGAGSACDTLYQWNDTSAFANCTYLCTSTDDGNDDGFIFNYTSAGDYTLVNLSSISYLLNENLTNVYAPNVNTARRYGTYSFLFNTISAPINLSIRDEDTNISHPTDSTSPNTTLNIGFSNLTQINPFYCLSFRNEQTGAYDLPANTTLTAYGALETIEYTPTREQNYKVCIPDTIPTKFRARFFNGTTEQYYREAATTEIFENVSFWIIDPVSDAVLTLFRLEDYTHEFDGSVIRFKKYINSTLYTITSNVFDVTARAYVYLMEGERYTIELYNGVETRTYGEVEGTILDTDRTIGISAVSNVTDISPYSNFFVAFTQDYNTSQVGTSYADYVNQTTDLGFYVYNESDDALLYESHTASANVTSTYAVPDINGTYIIKTVVNHSTGDYVFSRVVQLHNTSAMLFDPGLPDPFMGIPVWKFYSMLSLIIIIIIAASTGALSSGTGAIITTLAAWFFVFIGFLSLSYYILSFMLVLSILRKLTERRTVK